MLVQTRAEIVPIVERVRANLKRVTSTIPPENRWSLVMKRYLSQVEGKVTALGGGDEHDRDDGVRYEGKIAGIRYDSFGDFEGFWLRTEHGDHEFSTRERDVERIVTRAWREQIAVLVIARAHARHVPASIVFLRSPRPD